VRILVVEDEKKLAASLKGGLEADGFAVDIALAGDDGLWMAREHDYDGMVLDIMLPGMNGYKVCETLRDDGIWTPILMLTAKDGELDETEALDTGADDFLRKPFSHLVLVSRLRVKLFSSVRARATFAATLLFALALAIVAAGLVIVLRRTMTENVDTALRLRAADIGALLAEGTQPDNIAISDEEDSLVQVVADGVVVASSRNVDGGSRSV